MVVVARSLGTLALCVVPTHILWTGSNRNNKDEQNSGNSSAQKLETSSMVMFNYFSSLFRVNGIHANYVYLFGEYSLEEVESRYFFRLLLLLLGWIGSTFNTIHVFSVDGKVDSSLLFFSLASFCRTSCLGEFIYVFHIFCMSELLW